MSRLITRLKAWLPTPQALLNQRGLRWLAPYMKHPRLWHLSRKGVALGVALGIFFGLLLPFKSSSTRFLRINSSVNSDIAINKATKLLAVSKIAFTGQ